MKRQFRLNSEPTLKLENHNLRIFSSGFTLIELLVVLAIISTLLTIAIPRYFNSLDKSKETVLRANLSTTRDAIDKYYSDKGKYPETLMSLVDDKYLRAIPIDPITESSESWTIMAPEDQESGGLYDIHSGADGQAKDGSIYSDW